MSESTVLTLEIGGGSEEAVAAVNAVADSFANLQGASGGAESAVAGVGDASASAGAQTATAGTEARGAGAGFSEMGQQVSGVVGEVLGLDASMGPLRESFSSIKAGAAEASGAEGMAGMIPVAGAAIAVLGAFAESGAELGNELVRLTAITGLDQDSVETLSHAFEMVGSNADSLGRSVLMIQRDMDAASSGNAKYSQAFADLGISLTDAEGNARGAGEVFKDVLASLANTDPVTRQSEAVTLFGARFAGQLMPVLEHYNSVMPEAARLTEMLGGSMSNAQQNALAYDMTTTILKAEIQALGVQVLPVMTEAVKIVGQVMGPVVEIVTNMAHAVGAVVGVVSPVIGALGGLGGILSELPGPLGAVGGFISLLGSHSHEAAASADELNIATDHSAPLTTAQAQALAKASDGTEQLHLSSLSLAQQIDRLNGSMQSSMISLDPFGAQMYEDAHAADALAYSVSAANAAMSASAAYGSGGSGSGVPGMQLGGPVNAGSLYRVNEVGTEYFRPSQSGQIIPLGEAASQGAYGGGGQMVYAPVINIGTVFGVADLFRQIDEHLREQALYSTGLRGYSFS